MDVTNIFIKYIKEGRIKSLEDLKRAYHQIIMKTHPDAVGSDELVEKFIAYSNYYEEAVNAILSIANIQEPEKGINYRYQFYKELYIFEKLDKPYAFHRNDNLHEIEQAKAKAYDNLTKWNSDYSELFKLADTDYEQIKREKPRGPYMKYALLFNVVPVFHNIISYQLTGLTFYKKQVKQNLSSIYYQLEQRHLNKLVEYIQFLIEDMENGPAVYEASTYKELNN